MGFPGMDFEGFLVKKGFPCWVLCFICIIRLKNSTNLVITI